MVYLKILGHNFIYETQNIIKLFIKDKILLQDTSCETNNDVVILSNLVNNNNELIFCLEFRKGNDIIYSKETSISSNLLKKEIIKETYGMLKSVTLKELPWGMLVGIRPSKIVHELFEMGMEEFKIRDVLIQKYDISENKSEFLLEIAKNEEKILKNHNNSDINLYIGIPFCPSKCLYCSFTSFSVVQYKKVISKYIQVLCYELKEFSKHLKDANYNIKTIYIGGGTPTTPEIEELLSLFTTIEENFDLSYLKEYTFEAGRPDSITKEKLEIIKSSKVNRISINPQTMHDSTLKTIGRNHSVQDVIEILSLAKELKFDNINMDLIIGLPGENLQMFEETLKSIKELQPDSITVHAMALKRAARLRSEKEKYNFMSDKEANQALEISRIYANEMEMKPYYIYRQKEMLGNLENIGYAKIGKEGIYNIQTMADKESIFAFGAGAVSKMVHNDENRIERVFNVKGVEEYINRIDEMIQRKRSLLK